MSQSQDDEPDVGVDASLTDASDTVAAEGRDSELSERFVQEAAMEFLADRYKRQKRCRVVVTEMEIGVSWQHEKKKCGYGRADGIVVARLRRGGIFVASVEAKSRKTRRALLPFSDGVGVLLGAGCCLCIIGVALGTTFGWLIVGWPGALVLSLLACFAVLVLLVVELVVEYGQPKIPVIAQVSNYPGDERWVAISKDALEFLGPEGKRTLLAECDTKGVGLLVVAADRRARVLRRPQQQEPRRRHENYLECYTEHRAKEILKRLDEEKYGPADISAPVIETEN